MKEVEGRGGWVYRVGRSGIQVRNPKTGALTVLGPELFAAGARGPKADMARAIGKELLTDFPNIASTMMDKTMGMGLDYRDIKAFEHATPGDDYADLTLSPTEREYAFLQHRFDQRGDEDLTRAPAEREYSALEHRSDRSKAEGKARAAAVEKYDRVTTREPLAGADEFARRAMGSSFGGVGQPADEATSPRTADEKYARVTTREPMKGTEDFTRRAMTPMSGERSPATTSLLHDLYAKLGIITEEERASLDSNQGRVPRG